MNFNNIHQDQKAVLGLLEFFFVVGVGAGIGESVNIAVSLYSGHWIYRIWLQIPGILLGLH